MLPWACVASVVAWLTALALRFPAGDGDLLWQRWLGERILREHAIPRALGPETFAADGAAWTPHEWLFSTALAWTGDHGAPWAIPLLCALAAGVALTTVVLRCSRRGVSGAMSSAAVLLCGIAMMQSFGARAQVPAWACLSVIVLLLESEGPWAWAAVPATLVWANLHASAFLAPAVGTLIVLSALIRDRRWSPAVRRSTTLAAACGVATLATPLGFDLVRYAGALLTSPIRDSIAEWAATSVSSASFLGGALPLLLLLAAFGVRTSVRDRLVATAFAVLLFAAVRNVPVFALIVAPIALAACAGARIMKPNAPRPDARHLPAFAWLTLAAVVCSGAAVAVVSWREVPAATDVLPIGTAHVLIAQARVPPRVFCEDFAWCSLFLNAPVRFYMDGRCDPYPPALWRDYREVVRGTRRWAAILDRERVDAVLAHRDGALDSLLAERRGEWRRIASDPVADLYVRPPLLAART
ncbi:MAG TPA: hypothetical protein VGX96_11645 [Candidatus Elarobacter sp.]|nr:hypothetical protein [Candidatus Elarobacter sp.]